jgi:regulator of protease activity HflC (stomatin/prohibitin superfamily)
MIVTVLVLVLAGLILAGSLYVVPQQEAYIIQRLGKFQKVSGTGLHARIPFIDVIANKTSLRMTSMPVDLETKTLDNVFVKVTASVQYRVLDKDVATAFYELTDTEQQLDSYMQDALRSSIPALSLDNVFAKKDDIAADVQETVGTEMARYGITVVKTLIISVDPSDSMKASMDGINAAQREKEATRQRSEAKRIQIETQASAEAERTRLQGEGQANYRREIANGIVDQIKSLKAAGMDIASVNNIVMFNQYLDVMKSLSESGNAKTVVLPASTPGGYNDLYSQMVQALATNDGTNTPSGANITRAGQNESSKIMDDSNIE